MNDRDAQDAAARPKVIFFDAVGTLFGVRGSVGEIYAQLAWKHGVKVSASTLNATFMQAFMQAGSPAFLGVLPSDIPLREYAWWKTIVQRTFQSAGVADKFADFDAFFADLFTHFATDTPWIVYPDTLATLQTLRNRDIALGLISNFDSRIYPVLRSLDLSQYFQSVTISTEAGAAKPDGKIFQVALAKHNASAIEAWHVGDSLSEDYKAAIAMGLRGIWLKRA